MEAQLLDSNLTQSHSVSVSLTLSLSSFSLNYFPILCLKHHPSSYQHFLNRSFLPIVMKLWKHIFYSSYCLFLSCLRKILIISKWLCHFLNPPVYKLQRLPQTAGRCCRYNSHSTMSDIVSLSLEIHIVSKRTSYRSSNPSSHLSFTLQRIYPKDPHC